MSLFRLMRLGWLCLGLIAGLAEAGEGLPFDPHVSGFQVTQIIQGKEAITEINKLHGMPIDVVKGIIVHYGSNRTEQLTIWASEAPSEDKAQRQIDVMIEKMKKNPKSPFGGYRTWEIRATPIIGFDGLGLTHSVFRIGAWVYWLSGQEPRMKELMGHICPNP